MLVEPLFFTSMREGREWCKLAYCNVIPARTHSVWLSLQCLCSVPDRLPTMFFALLVAKG
jgi:hypothetical protein